jgi:acyl-coenzyme A thioesterase PaaI-like protein
VTAAERWAGTDFQQPPRTDGGVALCGACRRTGSCRLGLTTERLDDRGEAHFEIVCPAEHEGGPGVAHGGWTAGVLDEVLGHVPILHGLISVTGTLTVRFERPVPIERPLHARAWVAKRDERKWTIEGELRLGGSDALLAKAEGIFVLRDPATHFENFQRWLAQQTDERNEEST